MQELVEKDRVGPYQVAEIFEQDEDGGTFGVWDLNTGARQVLKLRHAHCPEELVDALRREYRIQNTLQHPNIAYASRLLTLPDSSVAMVLDHASGGALSRWMTGDPVSPGMRRAVVRGVLAGLSAAHAAGFVHRDVKPENVLLSHGAGGIQIKLADFGMAKDRREGNPDAPSGLSLHFSMLGTPGYMAPEQAAEPAAVDARADIYAVGCLLCEMLTGTLPVDPDLPGFTRRLLKGEWSMPPGVPGWAVPILETLLDPAVERRPQTCEAVLALLESAGEA